MLFEKYANDYACSRPGYPQELLVSIVQGLNLNKSSHILDLACGTGILGRQIQNLTRATIYGVDRSSVMLKYSAGLKVACAIAESLPLRSSFFDAVLVSSAFHWFDFNQTLDEITRVVKSGGGFAIIWYQRKRPHTGHQLELDKLVKKYNPNHVYVDLDKNWQEIIDKHGGFCTRHSYSIESVLKYSIADYLKLQRSKSYIGDALSPQVLSDFLKEYEEIVKSYFPDGKVSEAMTYFYVSAIKP